MYDIANLSNLPHLRNLSSTTMGAFENFDRAAMAPGAIPRRYKELIALGVALATQCPYSLEVHRTNAENAGVTEADSRSRLYRRDDAGNGRDCARHPSCRAPQVEALRFWEACPALYEIEELERDGGEAQRADHKGGVRDAASF